MFELENVFFAFLLTILAGLSTIFGVLLLNKKNLSDEFLSLCLGFSAGVMIYVSLVEIFQKGLINFVNFKGEKNGYLYTMFLFFCGILFMILIDKFLPENKILNKSNNILRLGMISALAVSIHNIPEGLATFVGALYSYDMGVSIAFAIAIHNIPEGIIIAIPVYHATKNKKQAFLATLISGLAEPFGALIGYGFLINCDFKIELIFGIVFSFVSGIMVYISVSELLPTANNYGKKENVSMSFIFGMFVMAFSLYLFK